MVDEPMFSPEHGIEPCELAPEETPEPSSLDMPGTDPVAFGDAVADSLRQYGTAKPQRQVIKAKIRHA